MKLFNRPRRREATFQFSDEGPHITDSGKRTEFASGAVRDTQEGKGRCDLLPLDIVADCYAREFGTEDSACKIFQYMYGFTQDGDPVWLFYALEEFLGEAYDGKWSALFLEVAIHFEEGAKKYAERNWEKGIPLQRFVDSACRHYLKWLRGDKDEPHDRAFCWNLLAGMWTCEHRPELNTYGKEGEV